MVEQIERIAAVIDRPNVGIIPWQAPARVLPLHGFHLYDHRAVVVGTRSGTAIIGEPDVPDHEALFGELEHLAVFDGSPNYPTRGTTMRRSSRAARFARRSARSPAGSRCRRRTAPTLPRSRPRYGVASWLTFCPRRVRGSST